MKHHIEGIRDGIKMTGNIMAYYKVPTISPNCKQQVNILEKLLTEEYEAKTEEIKRLLQDKKDEYVEYMVTL